MGSGLSGGPLTGQPVTAALPPAPAGTSAVLSGPLGAGASDVVTKIGSTEADGNVNASAKLLSVRTGIGGTEVEKLSVNKAGQVNMGGGFTTATSSTMTGGATLTMSGGGAVTGNFIALGNNTGDRGVLQNALGAAAASPTVPAFDLVHTNGALAASDLILRVRDNTTTNVKTLAANGVMALMGTDASGTPGAVAIEKGCGKAAIAIGAASVTVTNAAVAATSIVLITPEARDATCTDLIVVPGAGSFVVSGAAAATAAVPFSFLVLNIL